MEITLVRDVSVWIALGHGVLAFFSPCVIPLIPGFLGVLMTSGRRFLRVLGFFLGLSLLFSIMGALSGNIGPFLERYGQMVNIAVGSGIVLMGVLYLFEAQIFKTKQVNIWKYKGGGFWKGFLLGMAIGFVWIPCSSPVLASIFMITSQTNSVKGAFLLFIFSLGISIPFLTIGGFVAKLSSRSFGKPKWERTLRIAGSAFIITLGILVVLGKMTW